MRGGLGCFQHAAAGLVRTVCTEGNAAAAEVLCPGCQLFNRRGQLFFHSLQVFLGFVPCTAGRFSCALDGFLCHVFGVIRHRFGLGCGVLRSILQAVLYVIDGFCNGFLAVFGGAAHSFHLSMCQQCVAVSYELGPSLFS